MIPNHIQHPHSGNRRASNPSTREYPPLLMYNKPPAETLDDLYARYADTAEYGWFAFVWQIKTFAYWDHLKKQWLPIYPDVPFDRIYPEEMKEGDALIWNAETKQFEVSNLSVWNKNEY